MGLILPAGRVQELDKPEAHLAFIRSQWRDFAAFAWEKYLAQGRGAIVVDLRSASKSGESVHVPSYYVADGSEQLAPDLILGYAKGTRSSDDSSLGMVTGKMFADNLSPWSGDHCMDPDAVPGVLLTSRALRKPASSLQALAAAIVAEFGIEDFPRWRKEK